MHFFKINILIFVVFCMFRTQESIIRKAVAYTGMV